MVNGTKSENPPEKEENSSKKIPYGELKKTVLEEMSSSLKEEELAQINERKERIERSKGQAENLQKAQKENGSVSNLNTAEATKKLFNDIVSHEPKTEQIAREAIEKTKEEEKIDSVLSYHKKRGDLNKRMLDIEEKRSKIKDSKNPFQIEENNELLEEEKILNHELGEINSAFPNLDKEYEEVKAIQAKISEDEKREYKEKLKLHIEESEKRVEKSRKEYTDEYLKCRKEMRTQMIVDKTKTIILNKFKKKENRKEHKEEDHFTKNFKEAKNAYDKARIDMGNALYDSKKEELKEKGLFGEDLEKALNEYKSTEILARTIIEERQKIIDAKVENAPIKAEKLRKIFDKYNKMKRWQKVALSTAMFLPVTASGIGAPIVASYGIAGLGGLALGKFGLSTAIGASSAFLSRKIDKLKYFKRKDEEFKEKQIDKYNLLREKFGKGEITMEQYERMDAELKTEEKKRIRNKILLKAGVGIAMGMGTGALAYSALGNALENVSHATGYSVAVRGQSSSAFESAADKTDVKLPNIHEADASKISNDSSIKDFFEKSADKSEQGEFKIDLATGKVSLGNENNLNTQVPLREGMAPKVENEIPLKTETTEVTTVLPETEITPHAKIEVVADHGHGAIKNLEILQDKLRAEYGAGLDNAPESVKHVLNTDATKLAREYGLYKPEDVNESAVVIKGAKFGVDENGNVTFQQSGSKDVLTLEKGADAEVTTKYEGRMFDSGHKVEHTTGEATKGNLEDYEIKKGGDLSDYEKVNPSAQNAEGQDLSSFEKVGTGQNKSTGSLEQYEKSATKPVEAAVATNNTVDRSAEIQRTRAMYDDITRQNTEPISPTRGIYNTGHGSVDQRTGRFINSTNNARIETESSWTTPVPMTNQAAYEEAVRRIPRTTPIETAGNTVESQSFDIDHNPEHFATGDQVKEAYGRKNVIIDEPESATTHNIKSENWNKATDHVFKQRKLEFNSVNEYEKEDTMQRLLGHGNTTEQYDPNLGKNVRAIEMTYYKDTPEWETLKKVPAKNFFGNFDYVKTTDGQELPQEEIDKLVNAGVVNVSKEGYVFAHKDELERIAKVYKEATPDVDKALNNDMPIGDENLESYVGRVTRHVRTADDGTIYSRPIGKTPTRVTQPAPDTGSGMNKPNANTSTLNTQNQAADMSAVFPDDENVQGVSRGQFSQEVEDHLHNEGKTWVTEADKEADIWMWEKFGKVNRLSAEESIDNQAHIEFNPPQNSISNASALDIMRTNKPGTRELMDLRKKVSDYIGVTINPEQNESVKLYVQRLMLKLTNGQ